MDNEASQIAETLTRLEAATTAFEQALRSLNERQQSLTGEVERISASIEMSAREEELSNRLREAEAEVVSLRAAASGGGALRRTVPTELLAKQDVGEGHAVEISRLDAALSGLSLEQRIAVKAQLLRSGAIS